MNNLTQGTVTVPSSPVLTKVIKKYPNRKLYDTGTSQYVTLGEIYDYITNGQPIQVINNQTKEDITTSVLLNALVEKGKGADNNTVASMLEYVAGYIKGGQNV